MSLSSRLPSNPPTPPSPPQPPRPPSGLFGGSTRPNSRVTWEIIPTSDAVARFELPPIGAAVMAYVGISFPPIPDDPELSAEENAIMRRMLEKTLPNQSPTFISEALDKDAALEAALRAKLDAAWAEVGFSGAALVHSWGEKARVAYVTRLQAVGLPTVALRPTDPALVLNVLARARSTVLIANAPPALEAAFLMRVVYTDDPRIVAMVQASGYEEVALVDPPMEEEKVEEG
jgi:hypothetical protein